MFEASGTTAGLAQSLRLARGGGTVVAYGIYSTDLSGVPGYDLYARELTIIASRGAGDSYGRRHSSSPRARCASSRWSHTA